MEEKKGISMLILKRFFRTNNHPDKSSQIQPYFKLSGYSYNDQVFGRDNYNILPHYSFSHVGIIRNTLDTYRWFLMTESQRQVYVPKIAIILPPIYAMICLS